MLVMKMTDVEKIILADGWFPVYKSGDHSYYKHPIKTGKVTIPHRKDLCGYLLKSIFKQAGIDIKEYL